MKYLLDTHILLWFITNSPELKGEVREIIINPDNEIYLSVVSEWELVIKSNIGKLKLKSDFHAFAKLINELGIISIAINREHLECYETLPLLHRDPFDRMLIAQAKTEKLTVITHDQNFKGYKIKLLWS